MQDIAYRAMRQLGQSEALISQMAPKAPEALVAPAVLRAGPDDGPGRHPPYEEFTVVDQTVTAADAHPDTARAKGMVNAVLRRFLRERKALLDAALLQPVAKWNYPQWWIDAVKTAWPQDWQGVLATGNSAPPLTLRINARKTSVEQYLAKLAEAGMAASQIGPYAVRLAKPVGVHLIPGFAEGLVSVQDAGAQLAAPLLDVQDGMRVLDACAAPGGKDLPHPGTGRRPRHRAGRRSQAPGPRRRKPRPLAIASHAHAGRRPESRLVGRSTVRPHSCRRAVHRLRHRAPPPGYPLAAPQGRHAPTCNTFRQNPRQPLADAGTGW
jgi:hypothetical protein